MIRILAGLLLGLFLIAPPAPASGFRAGPVPVAARQAAETLDEAVARIRRETGGRILRAETVTRDGERVHRIKVLLPDGRVKVFIVRAR